jgi:spore coat polysaccharide biosynthesis protein SpsF
MGSTRLLGKTFMDINGRPILDYLVETILTVFPKKSLIIATSNKPENDILREYALKKELACYSGDEYNVASRYFEILKNNRDKEYFFRMCGDSPYYDTEILRKGLEIIAKDRPDFVTSKPNLGYPLGCNLEVFKTKVFLENYPFFSEEKHFEHVTSYFYERIENFNYVLVRCPVPGYEYSKYQFSVDTPEDLERAKKMLELMNYEPCKFSIEEKFKLLTTIN